MGFCVVTGCNRGIGLELVRQLADRGHQLAGVCRTGSPALDSLGVEIIDGIDVGDIAAVNRLPERIGDRRIDLLINNAGVLARDSLGKIDASGIEDILLQFRINSIGPLLVTQALLPCLAPDARVGIVSSRMGSIADNTSGGYYGYRMSKAAANMVGASLARDLAERGVAVAVLHPGYVRTEMTGGGGDVDPEQAASGLLARLDELNLSNSGGFWHANGEALSW
ncbi:MAG: SDR family oxidoreductase [Gammaproteobacteria bacterium]|jgi:NAD(P)-dependent dehydrogenase (short-subunit alcohol dehydrogenase family)